MAARTTSYRWKGRWTTSYRWEGRTRTSVERSAGGKKKQRTMSAKVTVYHALRELTETAKHSNELIDLDRTSRNLSWVRDDTDGQLREIDLDRDSVGSVMDSLESMLDEVDTSVKRWRDVKDQDGKPVLDDNGERLREQVTTDAAIRQDASILMEGILYPDPEFSGTSEELLKPENSDKFDEVMRVMDTMIDEWQSQVGSSNALFASVHFDETHPHVHVGWCPRVEDEEGRLRLKGAKSMGRYQDRHNEMRRSLIEVGYDATMLRTSDMSHKTLEQFKQLAEERQKLAEQDNDLDRRADLLAGDERYVAGLRDSYESSWRDSQNRTQQLAKRSWSLDAREEKLDERAREVRAADAAIEPRLRRVERRETAVGAREAVVSDGESDLAVRESEMRAVQQRLIVREREVADREAAAEARAAELDRKAARVETAAAKIRQDREEIADADRDLQRRGNQMKDRLIQVNAFLDSVDELAKDDRFVRLTEEQQADRFSVRQRSRELRRQTPELGN